MRAMLFLLAITTIATAQNPSSNGLQLWLKSDAGVATSSGLVDSWTDQSGNGHVFDGVGSGRPTYTAAGPGTLPVLVFDGGDSLLGNLAPLQLSQATVFILAKYTIQSSNNDYLYAVGANGASGSQMTLSRRNGTRPYHFDGRTEHIGGPAVPAIRTDEWQVHTQVYGEGSLSTHDLYIDTRPALSSTTTAPYSVDTSRFVIGNWTSGGYRFQGEFAEMLVYDRVVPAAERAAIENYLRTRAGLAAFTSQRFRDLTTWSVVQYEVNAQPDADWQLYANDKAVNQTINCDPSIFLSDIDVRDTVVRGQLGATDAPDYMGFVFGYQDRGHYYLFDWKRTTASYQNFGVGNEGMTLRVIDVQGGGDPTGTDLWGSAPTANTRELRDNNIAWGQYTDYDFELRFGGGTIEIIITATISGNVVEHWVVNDAAYTNGRFGYYVNSCQNVRFGRVSIEAPQLGTACGPELSADALVPGYPWNIGLTGASPSTAGLLYVSPPPAASLPLPQGCTVEVDLGLAQPVLPFATNAFGAWEATVPLVPPSVPQELVLQALLLPSPTPIGFELSNGILLRVN